MPDLPVAPHPRPAHGFSVRRSQRWILAAAIITAMTYAFRRVIEGEVSSAPARGGTAAQITGAGSPPPSLARWAIAYGMGFTLLSILSVGAPEIAASLAMLLVAGELLANGNAIQADLKHIEAAAAANAAGAGATDTQTPTPQPAPTGGVPITGPRPGVGSGLTGIGGATGGAQLGGPPGAPAHGGTF